MNRKLVRFVGLDAALALLLLTGCGGNKAYQAAVKAEQRGDPHLAYDNYLLAARQTPNAAAGDGLRRTADGAVAYWEAEAVLAADESRYADAWQMWMRVLDIRPDHPTAPEMILRLERNHPAAIAAVQADYQRLGSASLASVRPSGRIGAEPPEEPVVLASNERSPREATTWSPRSSPPVPAETRRAPNETRRQPPPPARAATAGKSASAGPTARAEPPKVEPKPLAAPDRQAAPASAPVADPLDPWQAWGGREFAAVKTLSLRDRRFAKEALVIDGVTVKLRDTDDDLEADLDLLTNNKRFKKIRALPLGRSATFLGQSGVTYRITVLRLHHKTRTVQLGVKPA